MRLAAPVLALGLALLVAAAPARADEAEQLAGLFVQSCLRFAGDMPGLRQWLAQLGLKPLPPGGQDAFLRGQKGVAYDASTADGKFVVLSGDDGTCAAIAERGDAALISSQLTQALTRLGIAFTPGPEQTDAQEPSLHHRVFEARKERRAWRIVLSTGASDSGAHPMISAIPE